MPEDRQSTSTTPAGQPDAVQPAQHDEVAPVPAPGSEDSSAGPGVRTAQGAEPDDSSPGAWTALAAPGKPDGEVAPRPSPDAGRPPQRGGGRRDCCALEDQDEQQDDDDQRDKASTDVHVPSSGRTSRGRGV